jgi:hypothetical protein
MIQASSHESELHAAQLSIRQESKKSIQELQVKLKESQEEISTLKVSHHLQFVAALVFLKS